MVWPEDSMSQLLGYLEHLQRGALLMVTSVWGTENNHRGINQGKKKTTIIQVTTGGSVVKTHRGEESAGYMGG